MSDAGRVRFGLSYAGSTWDISAIDVQLGDLDAKIWALLDPSSEPETTQYPPFRVKANTDLKVDLLVTLPEDAKRIALFARALNGRLPIVLGELPVFEEGKYYWIQITNDAGKLTGNITEIGRLALQLKIKYARGYPGSTLYSTRNPTALSEDQQKIYDDFEAIVYGIGGWVDRFAEDVKLPPPKNASRYEEIAREALRQQISQMSDKALKPLLDLKKEGEACLDVTLISDLMDRYQRERSSAMGFKGYVAIMSTVLRAFAGDRASSHQEIIQKTAIDFAKVA